MLKRKRNCLAGKMPRSSSAKKRAGGPADRKEPPKPAKRARTSVEIPTALDIGRDLHIPVQSQAQPPPAAKQSDSKTKKGVAKKKDPPRGAGAARAAGTGTARR